MQECSEDSYLSDVLGSCPSINETFLRFSTLLSENVTLTWKLYLLYRPPPNRSSHKKRPTTNTWPTSSASFTSSSDGSSCSKSRRLSAACRAPCRTPPTAWSGSSDEDSYVVPASLDFLARDRMLESVNSVSAAPIMPWFSLPQAKCKIFNVTSIKN